MSFLKKYVFILGALAALLLTGQAYADNLGTIANNVTGSFQSIGQLLIAVAYVAGFAFVIFGVLKFKQHKDNPQQTPLGTPIVMVIVGVALIFVGGFVSPAGQTLLGSSASTYTGGFTGGGATKIGGQ